MRTIASNCKVANKSGKDQAFLKLNASSVGEDFLSALIPHISDFIITNETVTEDKVVLTLKSKSVSARCNRCNMETHHTRGWQKEL